MPEKGDIKLEVSSRKNKKYMATLPDGKKVHFGDSRYEQFQDRTPVKAYRHLDHGDPARRKNYYHRHGKEAGKHSAKYFSRKYLW